MRQADRAQLAARGLQPSFAPAPEVLDLGRRALDLVLLGDADPEAADVARERRLEVGQRHVGAGAVVRIVARHLLQQQRAVLNRARQRARLVERAREGDDAEARAAPVGRLHADDAAERGRLADRAAGIGAGRAEAEFGRDRRRRAARAAARDARRVGPDFSPWIDDTVEVAGNIRRTHRELVEVGLSEQDRARPPEIGADGRFVGRDEILQDARARGRADARGAEQILDRERDALERAGLAAARAAGPPRPPSRAPAPASR